MTVEDNKAIVRRFYKAFEDNDLEALQDVLAPDLVAYNLNSQNRDEHIRGVLGWNNIFGENRYEIISQIAEGDMVASHVILHSTHTTRLTFRACLRQASKLASAQLPWNVSKTAKLWSAEFTVTGWNATTTGRYSASTNQELRGLRVFTEVQSSLVDTRKQVHRGIKEFIRCIGGL